MVSLSRLGCLNLQSPSEGLDIHYLTQAKTDNNSGPFASYQRVNCILKLLSTTEQTYISTGIGLDLNPRP
jgi:hypothetical protein